MEQWYLLTIEGDAYGLATSAAAFVEVLRAAYIDADIPDEHVSVWHRGNAGHSISYLLSPIAAELVRKAPGLQAFARKMTEWSGEPAGDGFAHIAL